MPLTMIQHAQNLKDDMEAGVTISMLSHYPWMRNLTVKTLPGRTSSWRRQESLGSISKRAINEVWQESVGTTSTQTIQMELLGKYVDIDKELLDEPTYDDEAELQMDMASQLMGYHTANDIVNANPATNILEFAGLKALTASSSIISSRQIIDAASLDLSTSAARATNADQAIYLLMLALQRIRSGCGNKKPTFGLMNDTLALALADAFRRGDRMSITQDQFDRDLATGMSWAFAGVPIFDAGFQGDQTNKIISDNYDGTGLTSAYFVLSDDTHTRVVQKYGVRTSGPHLLDNMIHRRWEIEYAFALQMRDRYSVVRVKNFKVS